MISIKQHAQVVKENAKKTAAWKEMQHLTQHVTMFPGGDTMTGKELKAYREAKGLTQQRLGELLGYKGKVGEASVQNWEYEKRPIPIKHFRKLAAILEIPVEKLVP